MILNIRLAVRLAIQSLRYHRMVTTATILGVAIGMVVVSAILIVDNNTARTQAQREQLARETAARQARFTGPTTVLPGRAPGRLQIDSIAFIRQAEVGQRQAAVFPTQKGQVTGTISDQNPPPRRGEEDYQAMRLAVRLASLLAFAIGAVIVFYTMRFSVVARSREFSLLLCLGEFRSNVALSLLTEALILGAMGTALGLLFALPIARWLLALGISTTGQVPMRGFAIPWAELGAMAAIGIAIALLGVVAPVRSLYRMEVAAVLQPRFIAEDIGERNFGVWGFLWLIPPLLAVAYLGVRPFLKTWLSVVQFFIFEAVFVVALSVIALWWVSPLLRLVIRVFERLLKPLFPLEVLLTGRRMRLTSQKIVFSIVGITLVFSLLTGLHNVTRSLKDEIYRWASVALSPYSYFKRAALWEGGEAAFQELLHRERIHFFRLSAKVPGVFPIRLIRAEDVNPYRRTQGRSLLRPGTVIFSTTLAARFGLARGDWVEIRHEEDRYRFEVIDITDDIGFFAEDGPYVDLKSYVLFSDGNRLFVDNLETTLGLYGMARSVEGQRPYRHRMNERRALLPYYGFHRHGSGLGSWQQLEINRDFLIFDFVILMSIVLAGIGVANTMLIQVQARNREFSVLKTIGISRWQITRLLLVEGVIVGLISALLALILGNLLGAISVAFLDRFTLFQYRYLFSIEASILISLLTIATCCCAAIYPALVAARTSSAESLHYE